VKKLADGNMAEIFEWNTTQVCKLWRSHYSPDSVDVEAKICRLLSATTLPIPKMYEIVEYQGRRGIIYERVNGVTLFEWIFMDISRFEDGARWLGRLHAMLHKQPSLADLPNQWERLHWQLAHATQLSDSERNQLRQQLDALPNDNRICHGDFHPSNILIDGDRAVIIDWIDATSGSAMADIARTLLLIDSASHPSEILNIFKSAYLEEYAKQCPLDEGLVRRWYLIMAGARLSEMLPTEELERLLKIVRDNGL